MNIVEKARTFAFAAHGAIGHKRKYTGQPYFVHLREVVNIVMTVPHTLSMIASAYLHDTVEDTHITLADIEQEFGIYIAEQVRWLTDVSKPEMGNRAIRKEIDRNFIAGAPAEVQTIKLADIISNTRDIKENDPKFYKVYMEEKRLLLEVLSRGDPILHKRAMDFIAQNNNF